MLIKISRKGYWEKIKPQITRNEENEPQINADEEKMAPPCGEKNAKEKI